MSVKANWHEITMDTQMDDPFGALTPPPAEAPSLARLTDLIRAEAKLDPCELKDRDWSHPTCISCPERGSRGALCGIGVAQEKFLESLETSADPR